MFLKVFRWKVFFQNFGSMESEELFHLEFSAAEDDSQSLELQEDTDKSSCEKTVAQWLVLWLHPSSVINMTMDGGLTSRGITSEWQDEESLYLCKAIIMDY